jgi:DtxR family Mn-dependent transcriptional regulator
VVPQHLEGDLAARLGQADAALRLPEDDDGCRLAEPGTAGAATVLRVGSQDPDSLAVLERLGLVPGARLEVLEHSPAGVRIEAGGSRFLVPSELAAQVWVEGGE